MMSILGVSTVLYCISVFLLINFMDDSASRDKKEETPIKCTPRVPKTARLKPMKFKAASMVIQPKQYGPGQNGTPVVFENLLDQKVKEMITELKRKYGYNALISDMIPFPRILPDYRLDSCRRLKYRSDLPKVSVVIPFRNERLSVLMRTVYGILFYSPDTLLEEIIIVDADASTQPDLKHKLNVHLQSLPKVTLIRMQTNVGLMMARQAGIDRSQSDYFICMDSHMEVSIGWLEPILARLVEKPKALLCSNIGEIDDGNFMVKHNRVPFGVAYDFPFFQWNFEQEQARYNEAYRNSRTNLTEPMLMGSVMGMMICMKKSWFLQLGGFDPGMRVWGSEQIELSIKVWMCGGVVEMIPCSFVAHIYRRMLWSIGKVRHENKFRLIEAWVDEPYKKIIYDYCHVNPKEVTIGDISQRKKIKKQNQCNSFQYFLDKLQEFSNFHLPTDSLKIGSLRNSYNKMCFDKSAGRGNPFQYQCHGRGVSQLFELTERSEVRSLGYCLYVTHEYKVQFLHCDHFSNMNEKEWIYSESNKTLRHVLTDTCLTANQDNQTLSAKSCSDIQSQKWTWEPIKPKM